MKHEFKEIVDRRLSHITWTEAQGREVLRLISEEERPVKKMRLGVVVVVAVLCLSLATALAAGLVFNPRVEAVRLAEQALEAKFGVTSEMLTHFSRSVETVDGGYKAVYTGAGALEGVLGAYTVEVKDGAAEATWSHDGADTSGGLDALAWGSEQLAEMLRLHKENRNGKVYYDKAKALPQPTPEVNAEKAVDAEQARMAEESKLSEVVMIDLAREAVRQVYGLSDAQMLQLVHEPVMSWYRMLDGALCYDVNLQLQQKQAADPSQMPEYTEMDGVYTVTVNTDTGAIESVLYESALGGNG